jgi:tetratricopeptide (TPR) repeat protein
MPFILSYGLVLAITLIILALRRRVPGLPAAWLAYIVVLLPVLGIFQNGPQIAADRYTYLAGLGWAILAGAGLLSCWQTSRGSKRRTPTTLTLAGIAVCVVVGLGVLTWNQVQVWRDSETLWTHALSIDPQSAIAHNDWGTALARQGRLAKASEHYRQALEIRPDYAPAHNNWGTALAQRGRLAEASEHFRQALRLEPNFVDAHYNLGMALAQQGKLAEASEHYRQTLQSKPDYADAHNNLGAALAQQGKLAEAIEHFRQALRLKPDSPDAHNNLGAALAQQQGKLADLVERYGQAVRLKVDDAATQSNLLDALRGLGTGKEHAAHGRKGETAE